MYRNAFWNDVDRELNEGIDNLQFSAVAFGPSWDEQARLEEGNSHVCTAGTRRTTSQTENSKCTDSFD